jgi:putative ABC transport system permease protein
MNRLLIWLDDIMFAEAVKQLPQTVETLFAAVASLSLVVGGIGITNIMPVPVTERTREVGLLQADGARGRDVRWQCLVEAV